MINVGINGIYKWKDLISYILALLFLFFFSYECCIFYMASNEIVFKKEPIPQEYQNPNIPRYTMKIKPHLYNSYIRKTAINFVSEDAIGRNDWFAINFILIKVFRFAFMNIMIIANGNFSFMQVLLILVLWTSTTIVAIIKQCRSKIFKDILWFILQILSDITISFSFLLVLLMDLNESFKFYN